jgi:hypothetical protein
MKSTMKLLALFFGVVMLVNVAHAESGLPGMASMTSPAPVNAPSSAALNTPSKSGEPLSAEQLQTILEDLQARNKQTVLDPKLTDSIGLTKNGEVLTLQYRAVKDDHGVGHGFFRLNGDMGYLVVQRTEKGVTMCRVERDLNLVAAVTKPSDQPGVYVTPPLTETAKILRTELLVWADIANQIVGANSQAATPSQP